MKHLEIEFKYDASEVSLDAFKAFCDKRGPSTNTCISGIDHFYSTPTDGERFLRHRMGSETNQLTMKIKKSVDNSFIRTEHNINLDKPVSFEQVGALCNDLGYTYNTSLFKTSFVYFYEWYILAYYVCYDSGMKETGRFIEIEMSEIHPWTSESEAWNELLILERICKPLGLSSKKRITASLFEMYRKKVA